LETRVADHNAAREVCPWCSGSSFRQQSLPSRLKHFVAMAKREHPQLEMWKWRRSRNLVFWDARECAPGLQGGSIVRLLLFARRGPTKEAHRRALNQPDGLLRSVAGQGDGRFWPVTLPRGASDQRKRARPAPPGPPPPGGPIRGGIRGVIGGPIPGGDEGSRNRRRWVRTAAHNYAWE
jgi:hypothetical protein